MVDNVTLLLEDILEVAFGALQAGDTKQAKHLLKKASKKYPRHYLTRYGEGMLAGFTGQPNKAITLLMQSLVLNPKYALAHYNLAISYQKCERIDLAIEHHYRALQYATPEERPLLDTSQHILDGLKKHLPPGFTVEQYLEDAKHFATAFALLQKQQYHAAATAFESIARNQPAHVQARGNLGICYLMLKDHTKAEDYFQQALALDPDYEPARRNLKILNQIEAGLLRQPTGMETTYFYAEKLAEKRTEKTVSD